MSTSKTVSVVMLVIITTFSVAHAQRFSDWSAPTNLGPVVNNPSSSDGCPFISKDGLSLYFAKASVDIYVSERKSVDDPWGSPQNVGSIINSSSAEVCPTLTASGHFLFFVSNRSDLGGCGGFDMYVSFRRNKRDNFGWEAPINLGCQVNSPQVDITPSVFEGEDGTEYLYFSSTRPGGPGMSDIYVSTMQSNGMFGPAVLAEGLNTAFNDMRPNVRQRDGLEIFFESNRPAGYGSSDLWTSTRTSIYDSWSVPVNLGAVVNGPVFNALQSEGRPSLSWDGTELYFMSNRHDLVGHPAPFDFDVYVTVRTKLTGPN
jgi:hypothetical protein